MAKHWSPRVVTDGLIFYIDAQNPDSYEPDLSKVYSLAKQEDGGDFTHLLNQIDLQQPPPPDPGDGIILANDGGILSFEGDGTDEFLRSQGAPFATIGPDITFSVWQSHVRGDAVASSIFCGGAGGSANRWWLYAPNDTINFRVTDGVTAYGISFTGYTALAYPNDWNSLTGTLSLNMNGTTSTIRIYVNGEMVAENLNLPVVAQRAAGPNEPEIGRGASSGSQRLDGKIASAKIYNRALTADEVLQNYNAVKSRFGL
jgi:hypothetical protein